MHTSRIFQTLAALLSGQQQFAISGTWPSSSGVFKTTASGIIEVNCLGNTISSRHVFAGPDFMMCILRNEPLAAPFIEVVIAQGPNTFRTALQPHHVQIGPQSVHWTEHSAQGTSTGLKFAIEFR